MKNKIVQGIHKALIESSKKNESQKKLSFSYDHDSLKYTTWSTFEYQVLLIILTFAEHYVNNKVFEAALSILCIASPS